MTFLLLYIYILNERSWFDENEVSHNLQLEKIWATNNKNIEPLLYCLFAYLFIKDVRILMNHKILFVDLAIKCDGKYVLMLMVYFWYGIRITHGWLV